MELIANNNGGYNYGNDYCYICYARPQTIRHLSCNGRFCEECIKNWTVTSVKARNLDGQDPVPCLQNSCQDGVCFTELQKIMSEKSMNEICEAYNENYYTRAPDISRCPKEHCNAAGFIKLEACRDNIQCVKCDYEWRDHAHLTRWEKFSQAVKGTFKFSPDSLNYLAKVTWSNPCPQCGMFIEKLDGCAHMVCQYCKYEFCWICLGHYPGYVHRNGDICGIRKVISVGFTITAIVMMFIYAMYVNSFVCQLIWWCIKGFGKWAFSNLAVLSILLNLAFSLAYAEKVRMGYYYGCCDKFAMIFFGALIVVWPISWGYGMYSAYFSENYSFVIMWPLYECGIVLGLIVLGIALFLLFWIAYFTIYLPAKYIVSKCGNTCRAIKDKIASLKTKTEEVRQSKKQKKRKTK